MFRYLFLCAVFFFSVLCSLKSIFVSFTQIKLCSLRLLSKHPLPCIDVETPLPMTSGRGNSHCWFPVPLPIPTLQVVTEHQAELPMYTRAYYYYCSAAQSSLTACDPMDYSIPSFSVLQHLLELAQNHVHWVSDTIQPSPPLSSPSPPAFNLSQHQGLF